MFSHCSPNWDSTPTRSPWNFSCWLPGILSTFFRWQVSDKPACLCDMINKMMESDQLNMQAELNSCTVLIWSKFNSESRRNLHELFFNERDFTFAAGIGWWSVRNFGSSYSPKNVSDNHPWERIERLKGNIWIASSLQAVVHLHWCLPEN